ncbi:hypothetical protein BABINDRAFT_60423 [Babjeviella inositovora NRRL Y-12698]|uniref:Membrane insertase YidC/Oxa/ALB C-terminal domain-containing protein n=1 Tax=Babjeviella inositovora NRRL Y-12698 TaxID=984486 RepID=A0A1E3QS80_9ASCO|nr:uncharacterized protein BABINDRAFT_60423 [Babjeviella inositovora NRRL Y-12698]ODQ80549.1 hypothetical protein BABINDRAFT_60423 [Babjeviella inositovora NRRL Y-12698]
MNVTLRSSVFSSQLGIRVCTIFPLRRHFSLDPTALVESSTALLQSVHTASGLPWWGLIPLATFSLRAMWTLPLAIWQRRRLQKQNELRPVIAAMLPILKLNLAELVARSKREFAALKGDAIPSDVTGMTSDHITLLVVKERRARQKALFRTHGCQLWKNALLPVFQIPLWILMSATIRHLSGWQSYLSLQTSQNQQLIDPTLFHEGVFWMQDLSAIDSMGVTPILLGSLALLNIEWNAKSLQMLKMSAQAGTGSKIRSLRPTAVDALMNVSRLSVIFLMTMASQAPAALTIYWMCSNLFSLAQNVVLDSLMPIGYVKDTGGRLGWRKAKEGSQPLAK